MLALLTVLAGMSLADALPGPESSGDRRVGPFRRDTYPSEVIARPLTLPAGMVRAGAALDADWIRLSTYAWATDLGIAASHGITHQLEVSAFARFGLAPLDAQRVGVSGTLLFHDGPSFDMALAAGFDLTPSSGEPAPAITVGFPGRLLLTDRLFLTFGGQLLAVQLSPLVLPQAALKVGAGAQLTSSLAVVLETDALKVLGQAALFRTLVLPLDLSATVAVANGFDLRVRLLTINLANPRLAGTLALAGSAYF